MAKQVKPIRPPVRKQYSKSTDMKEVLIWIIILVTVFIILLKL